MLPLAFITALSLLVWLLRLLLLLLLLLLPLLLALLQRPLLVPLLRLRLLPLMLAAPLGLGSSASMAPRHQRANKLEPKSAHRLRYYV